MPETEAPLVVVPISLHREELTSIQSYPELQALLAAKLNEAAAALTQMLQRVMLIELVLPPAPEASPLPIADARPVVKARRRKPEAAA